MQVWFTADLHLGHGNIIRYCQRPFLTAEERKRAQSDPRGRWHVCDETVQRHDEALIEAINERVGATDVLWILGDFCWGSLNEATHYRSQIRCQNIHFVWGNHDNRAIRPLFGEALEQGNIRIQGQDIWLNHYPMRSWNRAFHGAWHIYGHVHGRLGLQDSLEAWRLTRDVGVDACGYKPISFEELAEYMAPRVAMFEERKRTPASADSDLV